MDEDQPGFADGVMDVDRDPDTGDIRLTLKRGDQRIQIAISRQHARELAMDILGYDVDRALVARSLDKTIEMARQRPAAGFEGAPEHRRIKERIQAEDIEKAKRPDGIGAASRFRLEHGHLHEFIARETLRGSNLFTVAAGMGPNLCNAIVNLAVNSNKPELAALGFLKRLGKEVRSDLARLARSPDLRRDGYIMVDQAKGVIGDYDVTRELKGD